VRRAEFFRKGGAAREVVKGKRWLLLSRWLHLNTQKKRQLNQLFALNRRVMKAYLLKESLDRLWSYTYEGARLRYLQGWIDQLRWQRLKPMEKMAQMLLDHLRSFAADILVHKWLAWPTMSLSGCDPMILATRPSRKPDALRRTKRATGVDW
jgi:transposase